MIEGICELALQARDIARLEKFYTHVFGLSVIQRDPDRVWLSSGDRARLGLWSPGEKEFGDEGGKHVHFAFSAAPGQLAHIAARARAVGIDVRGPVEHDERSSSIYLEDPEGNLVEVWDFFEQPDRDADDLRQRA